jgi:predicted HTH domain antitoxin
MPPRRPLIGGLKLVGVYKGSPGCVGAIVGRNKYEDIAVIYNPNLVDSILHNLYYKISIMPVLIEDRELEDANLNEDQFRLETAIMLYKQNRYSLGKASKFAGLNRILFQKELGKREIPINFTEDDLADDLQTIGLSL